MWRLKRPDLYVPRLMTRRLVRARLAVAAAVCFAICGSLYAIDRLMDDRLVANLTTGDISPVRQRPDRPRQTSSRDSVALPPSIKTDGPPGPAPSDMAWIPGGEFSMGCEEASMIDARPFHRVSLDGFWMDKTEVTNEEFARFVRATDYVTVAERSLNPRDFPGTPRENLVPGSAVFTPTTGPVSLDDFCNWWRYTPGANWRHPHGPRSDIEYLEKHPVVAVAYEDAEAYARWANKRLPTEAEFEFAARGGLDRKRYAWGDEFRPNGKFQANTFQGRFPDTNLAEDGFIRTAPVGSFAPNGFGLYDMAGNVWEWVSDWYDANYYGELAAAGRVARNPRGPAGPLDQSSPNTRSRVQRGGSFLCTDQYCAGYMAGARGKGEQELGTDHVGFRCVRSSQQAAKK